MRGSSSERALEWFARLLVLQAHISRPCPLAPCSVSPVLISCSEFHRPRLFRCPPLITCMHQLVRGFPTHCKLHPKSLLPSLFSAALREAHRAQPGDAGADGQHCGARYGGVAADLGVGCNGRGRPAVGQHTPTQHLATPPGQGRAGNLPPIVLALKIERKLPRAHKRAAFTGLQRSAPCRLCRAVTHAAVPEDTW